MPNERPARAHNVMSTIAIIVILYVIITAAVAGATMIFNHGIGPHQHTPTTTHTQPATAVCDTDTSCAQWDRAHGGASDGGPGAHSIADTDSGTRAPDQDRACWVEYDPADPTLVTDNVCGDPRLMPAGSVIYERTV